MASIVPILGSVGSAISGAAGQAGSLIAAAPWSAAQVGLAAGAATTGIIGAAQSAREADIEGARRRDVLARQASVLVGEQQARYGAAGVAPDEGSPAAIVESTYGAERRSIEDITRDVEAARRSSLFRAMGMSAIAAASAIGPLREMFEARSTKRLEEAAASLFPGTERAYEGFSIDQSAALYPGSILSDNNGASIGNIPPLFQRVPRRNRSLLNLPTLGALE